MGSFYLLLVAMGLFYWLWFLYRGGWRKVVLRGLGLGLELAGCGVALANLATVILVWQACTCADFAAAAMAIVLFAASHGSVRLLRQLDRSEWASKALTYLDGEDASTRSARG